MGARGKRSSADLETSYSRSPGLPEFLKIDEPPSTLTAEQGEVWRTVMASSAGDLIEVQAYDVLVEYCRAVVTGNELASHLNNLKWNPKSDPTGEGLKKWDRLLSMQHKNQGIVSTLATKLRLATSSSVRAENAQTLVKNSSKPALSPLTRPSLQE